MDDNTAKVLLAVVPAGITALVSWSVAARSSRLVYTQRWWERKAQTYDSIVGALTELDFSLREWYPHFRHEVQLAEKYQNELSDRRHEAVKTLKRLAVTGDFLITATAAESLRAATLALDVDLGTGDILADITERHGCRGGMSNGDQI